MLAVISTDLTTKLPEEDNSLFIDHVAHAGEGSALKSTNGEHIELITGSASERGYTNSHGAQARFNIISYFIQLNSTHVVLLDYWNSCLRLVYRKTTIATDYTGLCTQPGYADGGPQQAMFLRPPAMIMGMGELKDFIIVLDSLNDAIRTVNIENKMVGTLVKSEKFHFLSAMTWELSVNKEEDVLILIGATSINKLRVSGTDFITSYGIVAGTTDNALIGFQDGGLQQARFNNPLQIMAIAKNVYLVSDPENSRIRLVDLITQQVSSICTRPAPTIYGPISKCSLQSPRALLLQGHANVYIGADSEILRLPGE
ncbi:hypothetical protein EB796_015069 [Bugula neritina]|uniref:Uncharacterized protein n=1 Tax=Bugula neritina TaxID=10212 RepID=A0A7J7JJZ0_BUGNE|nr:hypothetical protein EB796_015069 [Bugula neritina]